MRMRTPDRKAGEHKMCLVCLKDFDTDVVTCTVCDSNLVRILPDAKTPTLLLGRFELGPLYLFDGFWCHYSAIDLVTQTEVFVATGDLKWVLFESKSDFAHFTDELRSKISAVAALDHPNLVKIKTFGVTEMQALVVTEAAPGDSLRHTVDSRTYLPPKSVWEAIEPILDVLEYLHSKDVFQRAMDPTTIMSSPAGTKLQSNLLEIKVPMKQNRPERFDPLKRDYLISFFSPELCMGKKVAATSDVWTMAAIVYYGLTGKAPFKGKNPMETATQIMVQPVPSFESIRPELSHLSPRLMDILSKAMEKEPSLRYETVSEFRTALDEAINGPESNQGYKEGVNPDVASVLPTHSSGHNARTQIHVDQVIARNQVLLENDEHMISQYSAPLLPAPQGMPPITPFYGGMICLLAANDVFLALQTPKLAGAHLAFALVLGWGGFCICIWSRSQSYIVRLGVAFLSSIGLVIVSYIAAVIWTMITATVLF